MSRENVDFGRNRGADKTAKSFLRRGNHIFRQNSGVESLQNSFWQLEGDLSHREKGDIIKNSGVDSFYRELFCNWTMPKSVKIK